jgi:hypothetical protein
VGPSDLGTDVRCAGAPSEGDDVESWRTSQAPGSYAAVFTGRPNFIFGSPTGLKLDRLSPDSHFFSSFQTCVLKLLFNFFLSFSHVNRKI